MHIGSEEWKSIIITGAHEMGISVNPQQTDLFALHAATLAHWNKKMNLTTIAAPLEVAVKHFLDSIIPLPSIKADASLLDDKIFFLGNGPFPELILDIFQPGRFTV